MERKTRRVRLEDVAKRCGVSVATVSRALANTGVVRPELVRKIRQVAQDINYAMPSSVAGQRIVVLASHAAMIDLDRNQYTLNVMEGLKDRADLLRLSLETQTVSERDDPKKIMKGIGPDKFAGLILMTLDDPSLLAAAYESGLPTVLINGDDPKMRLCSIAPNNRATAALATRYLRDLGHKKILFLTCPGRRTIERRLEGWHDEMGKSARDDLVLEVKDWVPELAARKLSKRLKRKKRDFTAILCAADSLAFGAIGALQDARLSVPGDVSVMGMDGLPQGQFMSPKLTTMRLPMSEIGAGAVGLVQELMTGFPMPARRIELACTLTEGESTKARRAEKKSR